MRTTLFILMTVLLSSACPGDPVAPDATPCAMDVEWGPTRTTAFQPFSDGERAQLTLGFQGFQYVSSTVRMATENTSERGKVKFQISVEGQEIYTTNQFIEVLAEEGDGWRYADNILVYFNDIPLSELIGKEATISAQASVENCQESYTASVTIVDDDNCIEQPDGTLLCE